MCERVGFAIEIRLQPTLIELVSGSHRADFHALLAQIGIKQQLQTTAFQEVHIVVGFFYEASIWIVTKSFSCSILFLCIGFDLGALALPVREVLMWFVRALEFAWPATQK